MKWRFLKLDWKYAIGEFLIITAGVLIALYFDGWNTSRIERLEGNLYVERLLADLEADAEFIRIWESAMGRKVPALERLATYLTSDQIDKSNELNLYDDVLSGRSLGWAAPFAVRTTYEELVSTGSLNLISDTVVRNEISSFYVANFDSSIRVQERRSRFPEISYQLMVSSQEISNSDMEQLISNFDNLEFLKEVRAELNRALFLQITLNNWKEQRDSLIQSLQSYLEE